MNKNIPPISKKLSAVIIAILLIVLALIGWWLISHKNSSNSNPVEVTPTLAPQKFNLIPVSKRPYVTLAPLTSRNDVEFILHDTKIESEELELVLEYDRNKGVQDAVLRAFSLSTIPLQDTIFLGSKSAGGHITYHDDVIGGDLLFTFSGEEPYNLKTPWRYSDTESSYDQLGTADGKFQVEFETPYKTPKIIVMLSPGYPGEIEGEVIAGPYLFRGVGELPELATTVKIRLTEPVTEARLFGFDGEKWQEIEAQVEGKEVTAETEVYQAYIVTQ
jgi:hypothetical protein